MHRSAISHSHRVLSPLIFLLSLLFTSQAYAIFIQALPSDNEVAVGDAFRVDIVISGLEDLSQPQIVRGYHLDLAYSSDVAVATDVEFGNYLGLSSPLSSFLQKSSMTSGDVMLEEVSLWGDNILDAAQPDSFTLASIGFLATGAGTANFDFLSYLGFGIDIKGLDAQLLSVDGVGGTVNINTVNIPEPATILLLGVALLGIAAIKREG